MRDTTAIAYRPDIDGLRAIAVAAVVGYHAAPKLISGGFAGVDVFFVISGYLISSIILREKAEGKFSLLAFYARRIRRLFPALIAVLTATFLMGWYYLLPHEFLALGKQIAAGAAYYINFVLKREAGYFAVASDEKPLLHLWSLAVEEQFYLVWPVLLLVLPGKWRMLAALALVTMASFWSNVSTIDRNAAAAFFLPQNRFWELSLGAVLAFAHHHAAAVLAHFGLSTMAANEPIFPKIQNAASILGIALIAGGYWVLDSTYLYPGVWALIPCAGALLLIGAGPGAFVNKVLLSRREIAFIGLISYPLYLWHWPLLSFASILRIGDDWKVRLFAVLASAVLAIFTYRYIERPIRHAPARAVPVVLLAASSLFVIGGLLVKQQVVQPRHDASVHYDIGDAIADWGYPDGLQPIKTPSGLQLRTSGESANRILYFGDSNIEQYWPRIRQRLNDQPGIASVIFATTGGCPPIAGVRELGHPNCENFAERVEQIAKTLAIKSVVIGAAWSGYFNGTGYYFQEQGSGGLGPDTTGTARAMSELTSMIKRFRASGKSVWLVLSIPSGSALFPQSGLQRTLSGATTVRHSDLNRTEFDKHWLPIRAKLVEAARAGGAEIVDPMASLCSQSLCPTRLASGKFMYKDGSHLRASVVRDHADFIDITLSLPR